MARSPHRVCVLALVVLCAVLARAQSHAGGPLSAPDPCAEKTADREACLEHKWAALRAFSPLSPENVNYLLATGQLHVDAQEAAVVQRVMRHGRRAAAPGAVALLEEGEDPEGDAEAEGEAEPVRVNDVTLPDKMPKWNQKDSDVKLPVFDPLKLEWWRDDASPEVKRNLGGTLPAGFAGQRGIQDFWANTWHDYCDDACGGEAEPDADEEPATALLAVDAAVAEGEQWSFDDEVDPASKPFSPDVNADGEVNYDEAYWEKFWATSYCPTFCNKQTVHSLAPTALLNNQTA